MMHTRAKKIVRNILESAESEEKRILNEAKKMSSDIAKKTKEDIEAIKSASLKEYKAKAEEIRAKEISKANQDAERKTASFRKAVIDDIIREAVKAVSKKKYDEFLVKSALYGIRVAGDEKIKIYTRKSDIKLLRKEFKGKINANFMPIKTKGGCIVRSGKNECNMLIENIIKSKRDYLEAMITKKLFED